MRFVSALTLALAAATTAVVDAAHLERRQGTASLGNVTCGSNSYSKSQVDEAVAEGCRLFAAGEQVGSNKYPHRFNNREGLSFATSGPYQEFPILESGVYTGSKQRSSATRKLGTSVSSLTSLSLPPSQELPARTASCSTRTTRAPASTSAP